VSSDLKPENQRMRVCLSVRTPKDGSSVLHSVSPCTAATNKFCVHQDKIKSFGFSASHQRMPDLVGTKGEALRGKDRVFIDMRAHGTAGIGPACHAEE